MCRKNCGSNSGGIITILTVLSGDEDGKRRVAGTDKGIRLVLVFVTAVELMPLMLAWKWGL